MRKILFLVMALGAPAFGASWQLDFGALGAIPIGSYNDGAEASDVFGTGGGLWGAFGFAIRPNFLIGLELSPYRLNGSDFDAQVGIYDYTLTSIPAHIFAEYHNTQDEGRGQFGYYARGGAGLTRHSLSLDAPASDQSQMNLSLQLGAGLFYGLAEQWDVTLGASFHQTFTSADCLKQSATEGPFCDGDHPKFVLLRIGARYHRD